ncbi:hypothetical protein C8A00DRAFT_17964, partial [Chaetomidium leptoderma]
MWPRPPRCDRLRLDLDPVVGAAGAAALCAVLLARGLLLPRAAAQAGEPALTPLLFMVDRKLRPDSQSGGSSLLFSLANTAWDTGLVALFAILAVSNWSLLELALSALPVGALLLVYSSFMPRAAESSRFLPHVDIEDDVLPLSLRVAVMLAAALGVQTFAFGLPSIDAVVQMLPLGLAKALSWYFAIQIARHTSWCIATAIGTFGIVASRDPYIQLSDAEAVLPVLASFLTLAHIIFMLPKQSKGKPILWVLILFSLGPYLANNTAIRSAQSSALRSLKHPIELLIRNARADFEQLLERQSKNYTAAVQEYQRRYAVEPPPGFQAWYEFAVENQSPIIDEFDMIYESVSPFWGISGAEVVQIMNDAYQTKRIDLWRCSFSGAAAETRCNHPFRSSDRHYGDLFNKLLGDLPGVLPDAQFLVNHLDEPRVLTPPPSDSTPKGQFTVTNLSERPTWDAITKFCPSQSQQNDPTTPIETHGLPLITNLTSSLDLCANPSYATTHGLFIAPPSFHLIEGLVPVLSTGRPSTMSDIPFPSPAYVVESEFGYNPAHDMPWSQKSNHLYWAGSTTGAQSHFRQLAWQDNDAALRAKLVFDLDGNGISGRFYKLLASRSLVLKQTLLREWHDERLRPWVHYVPVSVGMAEVAEVVGWFLGTVKGREKGREVAGAGREWYGRAMREVDLRVYLWRLVLELARVGDAGRGVL